MNRFHLNNLPENDKLNLEVKKLILFLFLIQSTFIIKAQTKDDTRLFGIGFCINTIVNVIENDEALPSNPKVRINHTIKLDYQPKGVIIKFNFNNLTLYSDTTALFSIYKHSDKSYILQNGERVYSHKVRKLILSKIKEDTIILSGAFIPFNDNIQSRSQTYWRVWLAIRQLTIENKIQIFDTTGLVVKKVKIKKVGKKKFLFIQDNNDQ